MSAVDRAARRGRLRRASRRLGRAAAVGLIAAGLLLAVGALATMGWGSLRSATGSAGAEVEVVGLLTGIRQRDIGHVESFTLRTLDGRELRFEADARLNQTPGHMRDHMTFADPVVVIYRREGNQLVALRVDDAALAE